MARKKKTNKQPIISVLMKRIRETFSFNIGTIIFGAIFLYMLVTLLMYFTANDISSYQVVSGPLAKNQTYTGLIIRNEKIITADSAGYITYYARNNAKVKKNGVVYSIGESKSEPVSIELTDSALSSLRKDIASFATNFSLTDYHDVYSFKYELEGNLLHNSGLSAPVTTENGGNVTLGNQTVCSSPVDGIILYSIDGYENFEKENIKKEDFNKKSYELKDLKSNGRITAGEPVYKIITDEQWSICIPLSAKQIIQLGDRTSIRVKFLKDGVTQVAGLLIHTNEDGSYWGELTFSSGMIRYSNDRFIDIELVTNAQIGLKIPLSAIVQKEFYLIPDEFATKGGDRSDVGFMIERKSGKAKNSGKNAVEHLTIYEHQDGKYYIDKSDLEPGDIIFRENSNKRYVIGDTGSLEGVYCINKGYAVFRKIIILDKNDEYCIVEKGTPYGIAQFDHIVQDGASVYDEEILY